MKSFLVKTTSSIEYVFEANHFEVREGIVYFYDEDGEPVWIIKDWISFRQYEKEINETPDEFYDKLKEEET